MGELLWKYTAGHYRERLVMSKCKIHNLERARWGQMWCDLCIISVLVLLPDLNEGRLEWNKIVRFLGQR